MRLSVIIVNYNVKLFLQQCLNSVEQAMQGIEGEVIVVDNNSADGSCAMVRNQFSDCKLIENKENTGFSKANNQAIAIAKGQYVLLLNPDTVVEENTFRTCLNFMDSHPRAGALGVRMIDGKGRFLPESKRGLPTPQVAFCKMSGLGRLFPKSKYFNRYYLGHLDENTNHAVEILTGAFLFMRKEALEKTGSLDETFFMYGEDIDLSYRFLQAGYQNYYLAHTTIIHYKGESTKKGSLNYVIHFYRAMMIFARKHFRQQGLGIYIFLIQLAIFFRASLSVIRRAVDRIWKPLLDGTLIYLGYTRLVPLWEQIHFRGEHAYSPTFMKIVVPAYIMVWILSLSLSGAYVRPVSLRKLIRGILIGTVFILAAYALLPLELRFSRALILLGTLMAALLLTGIRGLFHLLRIPGYRFKRRKGKRTLIAASNEEYRYIREVLQESGMGPVVLGRIRTGKGDSGAPYLATLSQLPESIRVNRAEEVIFSARDLTAEEIIRSMLVISPLNCEVRILQPDALSIIGSSSIHHSGEIYHVEMKSIGSQHNRSRKRLMDVITASFFLLLSPLLSWWTRRPTGFLRNMALILSGKKSFVGYAPGSRKNNKPLPEIKKGILHPLSVYQETPEDPEEAHNHNLLYAKNYSLLTDLHLILSCFSQLGN